MVIDLTYHGAVRVSGASDHGVDGRPVLRKLLLEGFDDVFVEFLDIDDEEKSGGLFDSEAEKP